MIHNFNDFLFNVFKNNYEKAYKQRHKLIYKYAENINIEYLEYLCNNPINEIYIYTMNTFIGENYKDEIIGFIIVRELPFTINKCKIYIPLIAIHSNLRNNGYANILLDFIIKKYNKIKTLEIVLLSLQSSSNFYLKNGFFISHDPYIEQTEIIEESILMKKIIKNK
jgi:ribosomal protein S18 acetylase RimI-like enzyme